MSEIEFLNLTSERVRQVASRYQRMLREVDVKQELTLALILFFRRQPAFSGQEALKLANVAIKSAVAQLFRDHRGRHTKKPLLRTSDVMDRRQGDSTDPAQVAAASETIENLMALGYDERVVIRALIDPPADFRATIQSKNSRIPVSLRDIATYYGLGMRRVRKVYNRLRDVFQEA